MLLQQYWSPVTVGYSLQQVKPCTCYNCQMKSSTYEYVELMVEVQRLEHFWMAISHTNLGDGTETTKCV
jgi:hypothetical protein